MEFGFLFSRLLVKPYFTKTLKIHKITEYKDVFGVEYHDEKIWLEYNMLFAEDGEVLAG